MTRPRPADAVESPVLTLDQACQYLRHGRTWLKQHADEIGCIRTDGKLLFLRADLDGWIARHRTQQPAASEPPPLPAMRPVLVHKSAINKVTGKAWGS